PAAGGAARTRAATTSRRRRRSRRRARRRTRPPPRCVCGAGERHGGCHRSGAISALRPRADTMLRSYKIAQARQIRLCRRASRRGPRGIPRAAPGPIESADRKRGNAPSNVSSGGDMSKHVPAVLLGACGLLAFAHAAPAQTHGGLDDAALIAARADGEWLTHGGDYAETRYSTLDQIDSQNVG